ncbi:hypothetical protein BDZ97DRAFT_1219503 [Flammula alnicola]|nr:hypothetical protein BDZ97DRAFT_1219503 [Flammula alnicola]
MPSNFAHTLPPVSTASIYENRLPHPPQRIESNLSSCSIDSASNLVGQGDFVEGSSRGYLPSFHPSGSRQGISSLKSSNTQANLKAAFHGWRIAVGSWLNVLLILIPISWVMTLTMKASHGLTFAFCILALIPLVRLHDLSTRDLANRIGGSRTGLLNGSMSNFVEVVVAISALRKCELQVVQSTLIGSMLSKLLLVLGLCFFAGGMKFSEQGFDATATQVHSSLLSLSVGAVLLPAAYHFTLSNDSDPTFESQKRNILHMSHGVSIVLLFIYLAYLLFQLWSHSHLYNDQHNKKSNRLSVALREQRMHRKLKHNQSIPLKRTDSQTDISTRNEAEILGPPRRSFATTPLSSTSDITVTSRSESPLEKGAYFPPGASTLRLVTDMGGYPISRESSFNSSGFSSASSGVPFAHYESDQLSPTALDDTAIEASKKAPRLSWFLTIFLLIVVTGAVAVTVDWLVEAMDEISTTISKEWVALILLPAVGSVAGTCLLPPYVREVLS